MMSVETDNINKLELQLGKFTKTAVPFATKNTLNVTAFKTAAVAKDIIQEKMVIRNRFTLSSVRVDMARSNNINRMQSTVGSIADYMEDQEFGGQKVKKGSEGIPIATSYASGEGSGDKGTGTSPRKKLATPRNRMNRIKLLSKRIKAKNDNQELIIKVFNAVKTGKREIYHKFQKSKGIFRVVGGSKKSSKWWPKGAKLKMIQDLSNDSVTIPKTAWLKPAVDKVAPTMQEIHNKSLQFQVDRLNLFK